MLHFRLFRFALVGILSTFIHIAVAFSCIRFFSSSAIIANLLGFVSAFGLSYFLQSVFVFHTKTTWQNATRFFVVQSTGLLIAQWLSAFFLELNPYYRVIIVVFLIPMISYAAHRIWTYADH